MDIEYINRNLEENLILINQPPNSGISTFTGKNWEWKRIAKWDEPMDEEVQVEDGQMPQFIKFPPVCADTPVHSKKYSRAHILTGQIIHNSYGAIMFRSGLV